MAIVENANEQRFMYTTVRPDPRHQKEYIYIMNHRKLEQVQKLATTTIITHSPFLIEAMCIQFKEAHISS